MFSRGSPAWSARCGLSAFCIIQHPGGGQKQIALSHNVIANADDRRLQHLTDRLEGSSGSPAFDLDWRVVGLHHKGGMLVEPGGKQAYYRNQGIHINRVIEGLSRNNMLRVLRGTSPWRRAPIRCWCTSSGFTSRARSAPSSLPTEGRPQGAAPTWIGLPGEPLGVTLGNHGGLPLPASAQNAVYFTPSAASRAPADELSTWNLQRSTFEERRS